MSGPLDFHDDDEAARARRERLARREDPDQRAQRVEGRSPRPAARPPQRRTWRTPIALLAIAGLLVAISLSALRNDGRTPGPSVGDRLPPFAAPLAVSRLEGAVNLRRSTEAGDGPLACDVRGADKVNVCELYERGPVVLTFFTTGGDRCVRQLDVVDRVAARHPEVEFAAIALAGERAEVRDVVRRHRWRFPVGHDEEGLLASVYGVAVCPQITFARRGGAVVDTNVGDLDARGLDALVRQLERRG
ncbi:hypothetical protein [Conexibacter sp. SYSU D00693]|uniref:TlpA family protein disulfide reductase n=1 Tax=Conexibacter sp. SYSU D00693 TaxID=2812560 RepID=UPI00196AD7CF|nr:hypothetical protein [Conexibacter sp. SYSU D00693]